MPRLFFGIPIPSSIRSEISKFVQSSLLPGRKVPEENYHITILFLGNVSSEISQALLEEFGKNFRQEFNKRIPVSRFDLSLGHLGAFKKPSYASHIWIGILNRAFELNGLYQTAYELAQRTGLLVKPNQRFLPHLTISRLKAPKNLNDFISHSQALDLSFSVDQIVLYESKITPAGSIYSELGNFPLG